MIFESHGQRSGVDSVPCFISKEYFCNDNDSTLRYLCCEEVLYDDTIENEVCWKA